MKNQLEKNIGDVFYLGVLLLIMLLSSNAKGQTFEDELKAVVKKRVFANDYEKLDEGTEVIFVGIVQSAEEFYYKIKVGEKKYNLRSYDIDKLEFKKPDTNAELWTLIKIKSGYYTDLRTNTIRYDIRNELEDEVLDYMREFEINNSFFNDEYLNDYLNKLLLSIHPMRIGDYRPGSVSIKVLKSSIPNAFSMSNGTVIVTTGLLSTLRNEEELIGVLAHEVAHFVLDHHVRNIVKQEQRIKKAEFWATLSTALALAGDINMNIKRDVYTGGIFTQSTAALSYSIAYAISQRVGSGYSIDQEIEADNAAKLLLENKGINNKAYSSALLRIGAYMYMNGVYLVFTIGGTHPALMERVGKLNVDDPELFKENEGYDRLVSIVNSYNAMLEYQSSHFETSLDLARRNIKNGVATEDDYLLKNMSMRILFDSPEKNQEALQALEIAKGLNINPTIYIDKQEGLTLLRLKRQQDAISAFKSYLEKLESLKEVDIYIEEEIEWTRTMIHKAKFL